MEWFYDPHQSNVDKLNNVGCEARRLSGTEIKNI